MDARELLDDYNHWRGFTSGGNAHRSRPLKDSAKNLAKFESLAQWCGVRQIDPLRWIFWLFEIRRWMHPPTLEHLESEKQVKPFRDKYRDALVFDERQRSKRKQAFDPNRDVDGYIEARKLALVRRGYGGVLECLHSPAEYYGYHPSSRVCNSECPLRHTCEALTRYRFPFDVMALRKGFITTNAAQWQAWTNDARY